MKKNRMWVLSVITVMLVILLAVGSVNYIVDPLWLNNNKNQFNKLQSSFDERQQKTNHITFNDFNYDTLIVGTSRTTYINQHEFIGLKAYNYSVSAMRISEYNDYIEYAKTRNGKDFEFIVLELYWESFNKDIPSTHNDPSYYINTSNLPFYRLGSLLSIDTLEYSKENIEASFNERLTETRMYDRDNIAYTKGKSEKRSKREKEEFLAKAKNNRYKSNYDENYIGHLNVIKENNPNTKFIIFTNPLTDYHLKSKVSNSSSFKDYERWINDMIEVFGEVYNFTTINTITNDITNYYDSHHFYPEVGTLIAHRLVGYENELIPSDFGILVTNENVGQHLEFVKNQLGIDL
ncbi:hypothetical protein [Bacillus alkalicellulosilyticus]|uniref:hypothetical protein n=1 Tax=Alkalihalobacterium alkalicellulosilyticum TaxID=1912214 RepID=UPI0009967558|nr:hypothetical protein [Bacillus alkalicellulosilyticus]